MFYYNIVYFFYRNYDIVSFLYIFVPERKENRADSKANPIQGNCKVWSIFFTDSKVRRKVFL